MIRIHGRNYQKIAENIEERTAEQVAIKIASLSNQRDILPKEDLDIFEILKQGKYKYSKIGQMRWQPEETALMLKLVAKHGNKYFKIEKAKLSNMQIVSTYVLLVLRISAILRIMQYILKYLCTT